MSKLLDWKKSHEAFVQSRIGESEVDSSSIFDDGERLLEARHRHQQGLVELITEAVTRDALNQILSNIGQGRIHEEIADGTSYNAYVSYTVTRGIVGGWIRDLISRLPSQLRSDPRATELLDDLPRPPKTSDPRRWRIASLLQHMARLEGQQVMTPDFLSIAYAHETGGAAVHSSDDSDDNDDLRDLMSLEPVRDHLHHVLEIAVRLIAELDADTLIAEEVPDAYMILMRGLNARRAILQRALKHGVTADMPRRYADLLIEREAGVGILTEYLRFRTVNPVNR